MTGPGRYEVTLPDGSRESGRAGTELSLPDKEFSLMVTRLDGAVGRRFHIGRRQFDSAVARVRRNFQVEQVGPLRLGAQDQIH